MQKGIDLIVEERQAQERKWSATHDQEHLDGELAVRAVELAIRHTDIASVILRPDFDPDGWGLVREHDRDPIRCLTIAGALIAAEIDRRLTIASLLG